MSTTITVTHIYISVFLCLFGSLQYLLLNILVLQAGLAKKSFFFGHLFFNITNVFCAKKRVGHACICPRMVTS